MACVWASPAQQTRSVAIRTRASATAVSTGTYEARAHPPAGAAAHSPHHCHCGKTAISKRERGLSNTLTMVPQ
jgi:hypothetical protein